jgi:gas vesicle protein GvpA/GvpJ/GvpM family
MEVQRVSGPTSALDVLDRVLDKGVVVDAWVRLSLAGIDLVTVEARVVVASIATYLQFSEPLAVAGMFGSATSAPRFSSFHRTTSTPDNGGRPASPTRGRAAAGG